MQLIQFNEYYWVSIVYNSQEVEYFTIQTDLKRLKIP